MDPLLLGETLAASVGGIAYYGPWMPAGGNNGVGGIEVFLQTAASGFTVSMETKKSDEADSAVSGTIGSQTLTSTTPGLVKFDVDEAEDLVRYRLDSIKAAEIHFQFAQPLWAPN